MPLTTQEQNELDQLELEQLESEYAASQGPSNFSQSTKDEPWKPYFKTREEYEAAILRQETQDPESAGAKLRMAGQALGSAALRVGLPAAAVAAAPFTGGLSLAGIGAGAGLAGEYLGAKVAGEESTPGQLASATILGMSPVKSLSGAGVMDVVKQGAKLAGFGYGAKAAETILDQNRIPTVGEAAMATAPNLLAAPVARFMDSGTNKVQQAFLERQSQGAEKEAIMRAGQKEGYSVLPLKVRQGYQERMLNLGAGGQELTNPLAQQSSINNQLVTNKLARRVADIPTKESITEAALEKARKAASAPYEEVANVSPQAKATLETLRQVRRDAKNSWRLFSNQANPNPELEALAKAKDAEAELLESALEEEVKRAGKPGLVNSLKDARKKIAEIHVLEAARMDGGDISAKTIAAIGQNRLLTGDLKTIAQMANVFPESMRAANHIVLSPGGSKLLSFTGLDQALKNFALSPTYQKRLNFNYGPQAADAAAQFSRFAVPAAADGMESMEGNDFVSAYRRFAPPPIMAGRANQ